MHTIDIIKTAFEAHTRLPATAIHPVDNVPNNSVYRIDGENGAYIFKVYSCDWPEDGKLPYVTSRLREHHISHAKILAYCKSHADFPHGFIIEECLPGITADRLTLTKSENVVLLSKLAALATRIHRIPMNGFGYIGDGSRPADYDSFSEYMGDNLRNTTITLRERGMLSEDELTVIEREVKKRLKVCDTCPSVLTHGDLSFKNLLVNGDDVTIIDWDDSHALCWVADIARLTIWMKGPFAQEFAYYRKTFLDCYETKQDVSLFEQTEDVLHLCYGLDFLNYFHINANYQGSIEGTKSLLRECFGKCGLDVPGCML